MAATRSVWHIPPAPHQWHPAPWSAEIPRRLISLYTYPGENVLDIFARSFTSVRVAASLGRVGWGVDLKREYVERAARPTLYLDGGYGEASAEGQTATSRLALGATACVGSGSPV